MGLEIFDGKGRLLSNVKNYVEHYQRELLEEALSVFLDSLQNPNFSKVLLKMIEIENLEDKKSLDARLEKLEKEMQGITLIYYGRKAYAIAKKQNQIATKGVKSVENPTNPLKKFKNTAIYPSFKYEITNFIDLTPYRILSNQPTKGNTCKQRQSNY